MVKVFFCPSRKSAPERSFRPQWVYEWPLSEVEIRYDCERAIDFHHVNYFRKDTKNFLCCLSFVIWPAAWPNRKQIHLRTFRQTRWTCYLGGTISDITYVNTLWKTDAWCDFTWRNFFRGSRNFHPGRAPDFSIGSDGLFPCSLLLLYWHLSVVSLLLVCSGVERKPKILISI